MARLVAAALFCLIALPAQAFQIDCELVRSYVAQYGKAKALAFAIKNGATWHQIVEGRKCLKSGR